MNKSSLYISLLALVVAASSLAVALNKPETKTTLTSDEVSTILNNNPQIVVDSLQRYEQFKREESARQMAQAFLDNIEELNNDANTPFVGNADSNIVLVEFFDFSCGYCKRLSPIMKKVVESNPDIKVVFKPITFVSSISKYAAQAALAAAKQGKFMPMYNAMLDAPERLTEDGINQTAQKLGLDMEKFLNDANSEETKTTIANVAELANKVQIHGVPALVLNGKPLQTVDYEGIQEAIDALK